ncbi:large conductance mechanosensitive channel protein MscL [Streptomyces sp. NPDC001903]|uniref:large conductance mechanosensitive channel protein MscL n=1 Tax=Streptomyces sp. NPDC001903 TaxID=3364622 RepID=UPI0036C7222A
MSEQKKESVLAGFKAFLMRGNVVDLAVAVVIGAAFTNIVNSVVKGIISPLVGAVGTKSLDGYTSCLKGPCGIDAKGDAIGVNILWGSVLNAALTFLITAAVVYFLMVLPMAKYLAKVEQRRRAKEGVQETMEITELVVLKEIRDELVAQRAHQNGQYGQAGHAGQAGYGNQGGQSGHPGHPGSGY